MTKRSVAVRPVGIGLSLLATTLKFAVWTLLALPALVVTPGQAVAQSKLNDIVLDFTYGSEKKHWIADVTAQYNAAKHQVGGRTVVVKPVALGSNEMIEDVIDGTRQTHIVCPASSVNIDLGNLDWKTKPGSGGRDLIGKTESLVQSPVVIAMWRPMAEALGYPTKEMEARHEAGKEIGWSDILQLAVAKDGWASIGQGHFGSFKLGHTHPEYSNSGLNALVTEVYAGAKVRNGLTLENIRRKETIEFVRGIEQAVVHYGSSTGFFSDSMFKYGPSYLSAAVLYESSVVESYNRKIYKSTEELDRDRFSVVAIYPKEGTFVSDHPIGVVEREWVKDEHRAAAADFIKFLKEPEQQRKALEYGFRPGEAQLGQEPIPITSPIDLEHGVNKDKPTFHYEMPEMDVLNGIRRELWPQVKKQSQLIFVLDASSSMLSPASKITNVKQGTEMIFNELDDQTSLSLIRFANQPGWVFQDINLKEGRSMAIDRVRSMVIDGDTAMFDAIQMAHEHLQTNAKPNMIRAIIVLSDGLNTRNGLVRVSDVKQNEELLSQLLPKIKVDGEQTTTRIFTIYYGNDANKEHMKRIAEATRAESYEGNPATIKAIFKKKILPYFD